MTALLPSAGTPQAAREHLLSQLRKAVGELSEWGSKSEG